LNCVLLVGGEGTRLRPLTYSVPKQMLPIVEMAMLERVVGRLALGGVDRAVLSLGYKPDAFVSAYPDGQVMGVKVAYATEDEPLDTGGAIGFAAGKAGIDETFLAVNGDVLTDASLEELIDFHKRSGATATVALTPVEDPSAFGVVDADDSGRVRAFIEKPPPGSAPSNLINAGTYVLEPKVLEMIPPGRRVSIEREVFPALAEAGELFALASEAYWLDTGTPAQYLAAHRDLLTGRRNVAPHPAASQVEGDSGLWVIGDPTIEGKAGGCSLIGEQARIERGAYVEQSTVGAGATVGEGATVRDSVVMAGAVVGEGATVEHSILGYGATVGKGAKLSDLCVVGVGGQVEAGSELAGARI
jgi:mannose-1-phosphate guanylyltransferase